MKRNLVLGSIALLFVLIVSSYTLFFRSQRLMIQAEKEAAAIAEQKADIQKVKDFYWYNGTEETFFTVEGYNSDGGLLYVVIKQNGGDTLVLDSQEVVTESEAKSIVQAEKSPAVLLEARMGIEDEEPFWEVAYKDEDGRIGYYLIAARTGETIREYKNI